MQVAPAILCLLAPLRQSAADHTLEAPSSTHQGRGAVAASHRVSKLLSPPNSQNSHNRYSVKKIYRCNWNYGIYRLSGKLEWPACGLRSRRTEPQPDPGQKQGHPQSMLMRFVLSGAALGA
eukprot:1158449-Pelagomonas_calceolata.AAC.1